MQETMTQLVGIHLTLEVQIQLVGETQAGILIQAGVGAITQLQLRQEVGDQSQMQIQEEEEAEEEVGVVVLQSHRALGVLVTQLQNQHHQVVGAKQIPQQTHQVAGRLTLHQSQLRVDGAVTQIQNLLHQEAGEAKLVQTQLGLGAIQRLLTLLQLGETQELLAMQGIQVIQGTQDLHGMKNRLKLKTAHLGELLRPALIIVRRGELAIIQVLLGEGMLVGLVGEMQIIQVAGEVY